MKKLNNLNNFPFVFHGKHILSLNSGFLSSDDFIQYFEVSERLAEEKFNKFIEHKAINQFFYESDNFKVELKIKLGSKVIASHGGGTIFEYLILAKLKGEKIVNITVHEPRGQLIIYPGEEILTDEGRGGFVFYNINLIIQKIKYYEEQYGVKINLILESEFLGYSKRAQEIKKKHSKFSIFFKRKIVSVHAISNNKNDILAKNEDLLGFIDSVFSDFLKLLSKYNDLVELVYFYVLSQIEHVKKEGIKGDILGHIDLIRMPIYNYFKQDENITYNEILGKINDIFNDTNIKNAYFMLFKEVGRRGMCVEINLSGELKGYSYYGSGKILEYIKEYQVNNNLYVVFGSDSHSIQDEKKMIDIWPKIKDDFIGLKIYE